MDTVVGMKSARVHLEAGDTRLNPPADILVLLEAVRLSLSVVGPLGEQPEQFGATDWTKVQGILYRVSIAFLKFAFGGGTKAAPVLTIEVMQPCEKWRMLRGKL